MPRPGSGKTEFNLRVDWRSQRIEILDEEEDSAFRFDMFNAGVRVGTDAELSAIRLNLKEERLLARSRRVICIERRNAEQLCVIQANLMQRRAQRFRKRVSRVRSNLSAADAAHLRGLDAAGRLFPPGGRDRPISCCGFRPQSVIAAASQRLFGRSASAQPVEGPVGPEEPSLTRHTVARSLGLSPDVPDTSPRRVRPLTAAGGVTGGEREATGAPGGARLRSAPLRLQGQPPADAKDPHEEFPWLPADVRLPAGSAADRAAALRDILRRSRIRGEREHSARLQTRVRALCASFDHLRVTPAATETAETAAPDARRPATPGQAWG